MDKKLNEEINRFKEIMNLLEGHVKMVKLSSISYPNIKVDKDGTQNDSVNEALLEDIQKAAESIGVIVTITTAKSGHDETTTTGNQSRHMTGEAVDIAIINGIGSGGGTQGNVGNSEFRKLGDKLKDALVSLGYVHTGEGGSGNGESRGTHSKDVLWKTTIGGNHYNHIHVSNVSDRTSENSSQPQENEGELIKKIGDTEIMGVKIKDILGITEEEIENTINNFWKSLSDFAKNLDFIDFID